MADCITDITDQGWMSAEEIAQLAALDISVSDTETTGLNRERYGLTELASIRGMVEDGTPRLKLFQCHILPLRPAYQDYLAAVARAKREGQPPPPYDRRQYEYEIEPRALDVTGTEIVRASKDGPITGLKVNGKPVEAKPFYEAMEDFLAFTRKGKNDVYYNAPFDLPFLGEQIRDVRAYTLASANAHKHVELPAPPTRIKKELVALRQLRDVAYEDARPAEREAIRRGMHALSPVDEAYANPALSHCLYHSYLTARGFQASNTLDAAYVALVDAKHTGRNEHTAAEDVTMTGRVGLPLAKEFGDEVPTITQLFDRLMKRVDPHGSATEQHVTRLHKGEPVYGDTLLQFSDDPAKLGDKAQRFWEFLQAFHTVTEVNSRVPHHLLHINEVQHRVVLNAERKHPLSINFLKKCIFFSQLLEKSTLIHTLVPHHSTGNDIDVVLAATDADGTHRVVRDMHYGSLRANLDFLEAHPDQVETHLELIAALRKTDRRVGIVLLSNDDAGNLLITVKGHLRAFGECTLVVPPGRSLTRMLPELRKELQNQLNLGAIPHISRFGAGIHETEAEALAIEDDESVEDDEIGEEKPAPGMQDLSHVGSRLDVESNHMQLTLSPAVFDCMALRLQRKPAAMLSKGQIDTPHGAIALSYDTAESRYLLAGPRDAFHDFVDLDAETRGERPSGLIRDASWLLYRLQRLPGTYGITMEGPRVVLDQRDGVSLEALGILYRLGIPCKATAISIKLDMQQLMKNAFHWSKHLGRARHERMEELQQAQWHDTAIAPPRFLEDAHHSLLRGHALTLEFNETRDCWLGDRSKDAQGRRTLHKLEKQPGGVDLTFKNRRLQVDASDVAGPQRVHETAWGDRGTHFQAHPLVLQLAAHRLARRGITVDALRLSSSPDEWLVPPAKLATVRRALADASRFLYALSKSTGSTRRGIDRMYLSPDKQTAHLGLPALLPFLDQPELYREVMETYDTLAPTDADRAIRRLQTNLPNPRTADWRADDLVQMTDILYHELSTIRQLSADIERFEQTLGSGVHAGDQTTASVAQDLKRELATLGVLIHELSNAKKTTTPEEKLFLEARLQHIAAAQEKLSQVAYGTDELTEDLGVARKALLGTDHTPGLLGSIAHTMGSMMDAYAMRYVTFDADIDLTAAMQPYQYALTDLLAGGAEHLHAEYAAKAAFRTLIQLAAEPGNRAYDACARYLLQRAYPFCTEPQREGMLALYRDGDTPAVRDSLFEHFPARTRYSDQRIPSPDMLLDQYALLTEKVGIDRDRDLWEKNRPEVTQRIETELSKAYAARGRKYARYAAMIERTPDGTDDAIDALLKKSRHCFFAAGWDAEQTEKTIGRRLSWKLSPRIKGATMDAMNLHVHPEEATLDDLRRTIDMPGHAEAYVERALSHRYEHYRNQTRSTMRDVLDPHFSYRERSKLLKAIEPALKETHDLLMVKLHHVRHLQAVLVTLLQDPTIAAETDAATHQRIGQIGQALQHHPALVGVDAATIPSVHASLNELRERESTALLDHLHANDVVGTPQPNGMVACSMPALALMFDRWCKDKATPARVMTQRQVPDRVLPWIRRVAAQAWDAPPVQSVTADKRSTQLRCTISLPEDFRARTVAWAELQLALAGSGARLPEMPEDPGTEHDILLQLRPTVVRGAVPMDRPVLAQELREALTAYAVSQGMEPMEADRAIRARLKSQRGTTVEQVLARVQEHYSQQAAEAIDEAGARAVQR